MRACESIEVVVGQRSKEMHQISANSDGTSNVRFGSKGHGHIIVNEPGIKMPKLFDKKAATAIGVPAP